MSWYSNLWKFLVEREIKCLNKKIIITEFYLNLWISMVKRMVNFAKCCHTDITLLVLDVLQMKTSVIAPKISFWCLWNTPVSLIPRMVPALQWDTLITGWVSDWWVTFSKEINDNLSFEERDSKRVPHTFAMPKSSPLRYFCHTHQSTTLSHVHSHAHLCNGFGFILLGGKNKKAV